MKIPKFVLDALIADCVHCLALTPDCPSCGDVVRWVGGDVGRRQRSLEILVGRCWQNYATDGADEYPISRYGK